MTPSPTAGPARYAALITAAGRSRRMGDAAKKEYDDLQGSPVLARAVLPFAASRDFFRIMITVPPGDLDRAEELLRPHVESGVLRFIVGGATRQESVLRGLSALVEDCPSVVLIHDGARPWVSAELIERVLRSAERSGACVPLIEVAEAVKQAEESGTIVRHFPRHTIKFAQTPQGFHFAKILAAHRRAAREGASCVDDAEVYALYEGPVASVEGDITNRKITYPHDKEAEAAQ